MFIINIIKRLINNEKKVLINNEKKVLGRWNIEYCDKKINKKIDLSNEDNCGPCGEYILNKKIKNNLIE